MTTTAMTVRQLTRTVACPVCRAREGEACVLRTGRELWEGHAARQQAAGAAPRPRRRWHRRAGCPECGAAPETPCDGAHRRTSHMARRTASALLPED